MKIAVVSLTLICFALILSSCQNITTEKSNNDTSLNESHVRDITEGDKASQENTNERTDNNLSSELINSDKQNLLVEKFITAINKEDIELLMECVDTYDKRETGLRKAIEYYKTYFENRLIDGYEFLQKKSDGQIDQYIYSIYCKGGKRKNITVTKNETEYFVGFDNFIRYSEFAEFKIQAFINFLKNKDAIFLGFSIWNSMESINDEGHIEIYPVSKSEEVIEKYESFFELDSLNFKFTGNTTLENGEGFFIYNIVGKLKEENKHHEIIIYYSDGQVGIEDEWISKDVVEYDILDKKTYTIIK